MRWQMVWKVAMAAGLAALAWPVGSGFAEDGEQRYAKPYDGAQASLDAFRRGEEQRQANLDQQLYTNDQMKIWAGLPTSGLGGSRGVTTYYGASRYGSPYAVPLQPGMSLGYAYGFGGRAILDRTGQPITVFEPWPYVPGDIWGYQYYTPTRQPIGQRQVQTGPNRWESHPVYDPPLTPYQPLPTVDSPLLDRTPFASPAAETRATSPAKTTTTSPVPPATADPELAPPPPAPGIGPPTGSKPRGPREF